MPAKLNVNKTRDLLNDFKFHDLFVEELGWSQPGSKRTEGFMAGDLALTKVAIAELSGIVVYEVWSEGGGIPDKALRAATSREIGKIALEHVLVFVDKARTQSVWYWIKRESGKRQPREHFFFKGQPGDLFISKIASMVVDISELDEKGKLPLITAAKKVKDALDVERVIKRFYRDYDDLRVEFTSLISGIPNEKDRRWYASVLLNRLMFIYFLQRKFFLDGGNGKYLENKLTQSQARGKDRYYAEFLKALFFEAFAKPRDNRTPRAVQLTGDIKYLNGGLFLPHHLEQNHTISVPDAAFEGLFNLFGNYSWNLNDVPGESDDDINPDVLGYIFEKYINQKEFGAYYTRPEITEYLCEQTIHCLILDRINEPAIEGVIPQGRTFESVSEMLIRLDRAAARKLLRDILPALSVLDPAVGSGAFLVAALKTLITVYSAVVGWLQFHDKAWLETWLDEKQTTYERVQYAIKKAVITDNLYGVDIMQEATEIAKLRLFMTLVASAHSVNDLEPLPNIDFNIVAGNSLIGLMRVEDAAFDAKKMGQSSLFAPSKTYPQILTERNLKVDQYRHASGYVDDLEFMRDQVQKIEDEARPILASLLRQKFEDLGVKYEQATWDSAKGREGKSAKRTLEQADIDALEPFHWGFEFDRLLNLRKGFDAIITNPPWEILKPQSKEFLQEHSELVTKNKMTIEEFELEKTTLMSHANVNKSFIDYLSRFPHQSAYFRAAPEYQFQISVVKGKKQGSDINLYKLFIERCYHLLRPGGLCGVVVPSGIYTDLGAKGLRTMLFEDCRITGLFGFENKKGIFEGVHKSFKFVVMTFEKGGKTVEFPAAFMQLEVSALSRFPEEIGMSVSVASIKELAPHSLAIPEFHTSIQAGIADKLHAFQPLGMWKNAKPVEFAREFMSSDDHHLFNDKADGLTVFEGKMIEQFTCDFEAPKWWISNAEFKSTRFYSRNDWKRFRFAIRRVASSTNSRTLIAAILPPNSVVVHSLFVNVGDILNGKETLYFIALLNSFVLDYALRAQVTSNVTKFNLLQLTAPLPGAGGQSFVQIVRRAARLVCVSREFEALWDEVDQEIGLDPAADNPVAGGCQWRPSCGASGRSEGQIRAELDALVARLYGLTEAELIHVLSTFNAIDGAVKEAVVLEFKKLPSAIPADLPMDVVSALDVIRSGEGNEVEFKSSFAVPLDFDRGKWEALGLIADVINQKVIEAKKDVTHSALKTIAAFINTSGGTLFIGVRDDGVILGLEPDFAVAQKPNVDGLQLDIRAILNNRKRFDPLPHGLVDIIALKHEGKDFLRIDVGPDFDPLHLDGDKVFIRDGNQTVHLTGPPLAKWIAKRHEEKLARSANSSPSQPDVHSLPWMPLPEPLKDPQIAPLQAQGYEFKGPRLSGVAAYLADGWQYVTWRSPDGALFRTCNGLPVEDASIWVMRSPANGEG